MVVTEQSDLPCFAEGVFVNVNKGTRNSSYSSFSSSAASAREYR